MTPTEAREAITKAAIDGVAALAGPPACYMEAERSRPSTSTPWIRVAIRGLSSDPMTHGPSGGRHVQRRGFVIGQCFVAHGTADGAAAAESLAQSFRDIFEGVDLTAAVATTPNGINFTTADIRLVGVDGSWVQANAEITFSFTEVV